MQIGNVQNAFAINFDYPRRVVHQRRGTDYPIVNLDMCQDTRGVRLRRPTRDFITKPAAGEPHDSIYADQTVPAQPVGLPVVFPVED